jgi:cytochrome c-type biogenesis protein CcmI
MGLITGLLTLPLAPVRGVAWIAEQVQTEAERQWSDPTVLQAQLSAVQEQREAGEIDEAEAERLEEELVQRLLAIDRPAEAGDIYDR